MRAQPGTLAAAEPPLRAAPCESRQWSALSDRSDPIMDLALDDERNVLYCLTRASTIQASRRRPALARSPAQHQLPTSNQHLLLRLARSSPPPLILYPSPFPPVFCYTRVYKYIHACIH